MSEGKIKGRKTVSKQLRVLFKPMKKGSIEDMMSHWSKSSKPKLLWKKMEEKVVKEHVDVEEDVVVDVVMAKEEEEEKIVIIKGTGYKTEVSKSLEANKGHK